MIIGVFEMPRSTDDHLEMHYEGEAFTMEMNSKDKNACVNIVSNQNIKVV
jgi:hypothetical protein